jgi:hypothetical protein
MQTERDKARVLEGLEGAAAGALDRGEAERILSALGKRVFLLHNVHENRPVVFQTRWTMSYLRGPMSRAQIAALTRGSEGRRVRGSEGPTVPDLQGSWTPSIPGGGTRPVVPPGIDQYFLPDAAAGRAEVEAPVYSPVVLGAARVTFSDTKLGIDTSRDVLFAAPITNNPVPVDWQHATEVSGTAALQREPATGARFADVPPAALKPKNYEAWQKAFSRWLGQSQRIELLRHRQTKLTSTVGETAREFHARVQDALRETRDAEVEAVQKKFAAKRQTLADRLRRAEGAVDREQQQASQQKTQTMLSMGAAALGALFGRKAFSTGTLGRATTAARGMGRSMKEKEDVKRAAENVAALRGQLEDFDESVRAETQAIAARYQGAPEIEAITIAPKRGQVAVQFVALGWDPR